MSSGPMLGDCEREGEGDDWNRRRRNSKRSGGRRSVNGLTLDPDPAVDDDFFPSFRPPPNPKVKGTAKFQLKSLELGSNPNVNNV